MRVVEVVGADHRSQWGSESRCVLHRRKAASRRDAEYGARPPHFVPIDSTQWWDGLNCCGAFAWKYIDSKLLTKRNCRKSSGRVMSVVSPSGTDSGRRIISFLGGSAGALIIGTIFLRLITCLQLHVKNRERLWIGCVQRIQGTSLHAVSSG